MSKRTVLTRILAVCLIVVLVITSFSVTCFAKTPSIDSTFKTLSLGTNQLKKTNFDSKTDTLLGCFKAPATGEYSIKAVNNCEIEDQHVILLDKNFEEIDGTIYLDPTKSYTFKTISLKKNEVLYFYADYTYSIVYDSEKTLVAKVIINQVDKKPSLNKTTASLKKQKSVQLKLKNNKKKVIWVSANKKIASVTSKGLVKGKKKGKTYIYAIANHKLYKCKVTVN